MLSVPEFNVDNATLATVPHLTDRGYRDSGVFTAAFGINLRDQVRPDDPVPLQFKYEPADCRIFYSLANAFNFTRLWSDAVIAAFDDNSMCVDGSTGFSRSSNDVPKSATNIPLSLSFDIAQPDAALFDENLDQSGGPQNSEQAAQSFSIQYCSSAGTCPSPQVQKCESVQATICGILDTYNLCLPQTLYSNQCDPTTTKWEPILDELGRGGLSKRALPSSLVAPKITGAKPPVGGAAPAPPKLGVTVKNQPAQPVKKYGQCRPLKNVNLPISSCYTYSA